MAAHPEVALELLGGEQQIAPCRDLRGNGGREGHVEVFLPADQRVVGAAVGHVGALVIGEPEADRGELLLLDLRGLLVVEARDDVLEARARGDGLEQLLGLARIVQRRDHAEEAAEAEGLIEGLALLGAHGGIFGIAHVGEPREDEAVDAVDGTLGERVGVLAHVVDDVCHGGLLGTVRYGKRSTPALSGHHRRAAQGIIRRTI